MTRAALAQTEGFAERNQMSLRFRAIPPCCPYGGTLAFDQAEMRELLAYGQRCAEEGRIWLDAKRALAPVAPTQRGFPSDRLCARLP